MQYKILLIAHLALKNKEICDGQTVKSRTLYESFKKKYKEKVRFIDSYDAVGFRKIIELMKMIFYIRKSKNIIILPGQNSLPIYIKIIKFFKKRKSLVHYSVVGGWLPEFLEGKEKLIQRLNKIDYIYCETNGLKNILSNKYGFNNLVVAPNYKNLQNYRHKVNSNKNIKFVFFARVIKEKGIELAIEAMKDFPNATLDIYGPVEDSYLNKISKLFTHNVKYQGCRDSNDSISVLTNYDVLLFPTYYDGECFPGTLIDAFFSGIPVICSDWKYNSEIINSSNGVLFETNNLNSMKNAIKKVYDIDYLNLLKKGSFQTRLQYTEDMIFPIYDTKLE